MKLSLAITIVLLLPIAIATPSCRRAQEEPKAAAAPAAGMPKPVRDAPGTATGPALALVQAWFWNDAQGRPNPGPARLDVWRPGPAGWTRTRLEDADSNVFHKAMFYDGGILTIGAEHAILKQWKVANGEWKDVRLWERSWGGKFDRLRDMEIGDVDADGREEIVIATHDAGVVAVLELTPDGVTATELDQEPDTFVHEIEIGDVDGDGKLEFFATPSDRNRANESQAGGVVMYRWDGSAYRRSWVEQQQGTHAKEILAHDMNGDGKSELFGVLEAEIDPSNKSRLLRPVEIREYVAQPDGSFQPRTIATIDDRLTRFLVPGDFDGDGRKELIAAAFKRGLFHVVPPSAGDAPWRTVLIDADSSGFEHASYAADLDGNGKLELYVAADDQAELRRYTYQPDGSFKRETLGKLDADVLTFNITHGQL
jgi:hypothetical protein